MSSLDNIPLFAALPKEEIRNFEKVLHPLEVASDTLLMREGEQGERFFIILEGELEIIKAYQTENERLLGIRGPGEYIGEMSLLDQDELRTASVRTRTNSKLLEMNRDDFDEMLQRRPTLAVLMLRELSARLRASENATIRDLEEKNNELTRAYQDLQKVQSQLIEKERLEQELQVARRIQTSILPNDLPRLEGFNFGVQMEPARAVGGDFFDFISLDDDNLAILIGDVSDKGVPAALFMALTRSLFRAECTRYRLPSHVLHRVNNLLREMNEENMFVTVLYGIFNRIKGDFSYARAGHELPLLVNDKGKMSIPELGHGQPLGIFLEPELDVNRLKLESGGLLFLYTDGATDVRNKTGDFFGFERLQACVSEQIGNTAQDVCGMVLKTLEEFQGDAPQADDITLLAVKAQD
jgi:sigma-B regulation protein RsbU (phosphoserine phosphatase)